jgi:hypothetical protein
MNGYTDSSGILYQESARSDPRYFPKMDPDHCCTGADLPPHQLFVMMMVLNSQEKNVTTEPIAGSLFTSQDCSQQFLVFCLRHT